MMYPVTMVVTDGVANLRTLSHIFFSVGIPFTDEL